MLPNAIDYPRVTYEQAVRIVDHYDLVDELLFDPIEFAWDLKRQFGDEGFDLLCGLTADVAEAEWGSIDTARSPSQFDRLLADELAWIDGGGPERERRRAELNSKKRKLTRDERFFLMYGREPDARDLELRKVNERRTAIMVKETQAGEEPRHHSYYLDARGNVEPNNPDNVRVFLGICGLVVRWNTWLERMEIVSDWIPPVRGPDDPVFKDWTYVDDTVVARMLTRARRTQSRFVATKDFFWDTLLAIAHENKMDPACEILDELEQGWDAVPRLSTWLSHACGVPNDAYHAAVGRNIIGGMVRRIREPGRKHDTVALLIGPQGSGKSTLAANLAPRTEWFSDEIQMGADPKDLILSLAGKCVIEFSELSGSKRDVDNVKAMLSRQVDRGRTAYARSVSERPRRNIFIASTNNESALIDDTGNRRFLPVKIANAINVEWLREHRDALIGEAAHLHARGDDFAVPRSVWSVAAEHQESARQQRTHEIYFAEWFAVTDEAVYITPADLATCVKSVEPGARNTAYARTLRNHGFVSGTKRLEGRTVKVWHRGELANATRLVPRSREGGTMTPSRFQMPDVGTPGLAPPPVRLQPRGSAQA